MEAFGINAHTGAGETNSDWSTRWARVQTLLQWADRFEKQRMPRQETDSKPRDTSIADPRRAEARATEAMPTTTRSAVKTHSTATKPSPLSPVSKPTQSKLSRTVSVTRKHKAQVCSHGNGPSCARCRYIVTVLLPKTTAEALAKAKRRPSQTQKRIKNQSQMPSRGPGFAPLTGSVARDANEMSECAKNDRNLASTRKSDGKDDHDHAAARDCSDNISGAHTRSSDCFHMLRQFLCTVCGVGEGDDGDDIHPQKEQSVVLSTMGEETVCAIQQTKKQNGLTWLALSAP